MADGSLNPAQQFFHKMMMDKINEPIDKLEKLTKAIQECLAEKQKMTDDELADLFDKVQNLDDMKYVSEEIRKDERAIISERLRVVFDL